MSRGMTLLEVLLSLALLGGIALACASWVGTAARGTESTAERLRWHSAADASLGLIGDLIATGDFNPNEQRVPERPRVRVETNSLEIDTRLNGRSAIALVEMKEDQLVLRAPPDDERLLVADVAQFEAELDAETQVLSVTLRSRAGDERSRRYSLP